MAVPKGKVSKQRGNKRFASNYKATMPTLVECPHCNKMKQSHRICKHCGYYDGVQVINNEPEKE